MRASAQNEEGDLDASGILSIRLGGGFPARTPEHAQHALHKNCEGTSQPSVKAQMDFGRVRTRLSTKFLVVHADICLDLLFCRFPRLGQQKFFARGRNAPSCFGKLLRNTP
jgi:hypothetical protein